MKRSPERIAWMVLFASLFACCALAVGVPATAYTFVNTATIDASANVKLQAGILKAHSQFETENDARVVSLDGRPLSEGSTVIVGPESVGLLTFGSDPATPFHTFQLYSNARLRINKARLPRFTGAGLGDEFTLSMNDGRMQITAQPPQGRPFTLRIIGDHAITTINTPGSYSIEETETETRVNVAEGQALVSTLNGDQAFTFYGGQRTAVSDNGIAGVLPAFRNLIRNGDFEPPLERDWQVQTLIDPNSAVTGTANIVGMSPNTSLLLRRTGSNLGWGRTAVTQDINEDVRDRRAVQLRVNFSILEQEIPVCGGEGSECPFMVRVDYRNQNGADAYWQQGFYAAGTPSAQLPDYVRSNNQGKHVARRLGVPETFEWENLIDLLPDMQTIKSITLYAEGHSVQTQVNSVELLLQD
jgi:hypothetical protein